MLPLHVFCTYFSTGHIPTFDPFANFIGFIPNMTGIGSRERLIGSAVLLIFKSGLSHPLGNLVDFGRFLVFHGEILEVHLLIRKWSKNC